jgi:hypothetical protein
LPNSSLTQTEQGMLATPMSAWRERTRWTVALAATLGCAVWAIYLTRHWENSFNLPDVAQYLRIARSDMAHVMQPFAARPMAPLLAAAVARLTHWDLETTFVRLGVVYLAVTLSITFSLIVRTAAPRWMLAAIFFLPFWPVLFQELAYPDLLYAALIAVLLWLLLREDMMSAALLMFPLMFTRESTWLTLACLLVATWPIARWKHRLTAVCAAIAGAALVHRLTTTAAGNTEHLPQAAYVLAKLPWNFARNVLGIMPWSNVQPELCPVPRWQTALHFGPVTAVGICGFDHTGQIVMLQETLSVFGLLPLLVAFFWWRKREFAGRSVLLRFILLYGGSCFMLAPALGTSFVHLMGYAWPLFAVAPALLLDELRKEAAALPRATAAGAGFAIAHLAVCASFFWLHIQALIVADLVLWVAGFLLLRQWMGVAQKHAGNAT